MTHVAVCRVLPYPTKALFALAADVERYPDFVPGWRAATIVRREGNLYCTDQTVGFGPLTQRFTSKTVLEPPMAIKVTAIDGPFERFGLAWRFRALDGAACEVMLEVDIELRPALLNALFAAQLAGELEAVLAAFEARARRQLGPALPVDTDQGARLAG